MLDSVLLSILQLDHLMFPTGCLIVGIYKEFGLCPKLTNPINDIIIFLASIGLRWSLHHQDVLMANHKPGNG